MRKISKKASSQSFVEIPEFPPVVLKGGIESRRVVEQYSSLGEVLDAQANVLDEWREATIQLLLKPLVDEDDGLDLTGEEYEDSTKIQDELVAYIQALRAIIEDRFDALTGQSNELVRTEIKSALRLAKNGEGAAPEKTIALLKERDQVKPPENLGSIRGIISDLRGIAVSLKIDADGGSARAATELAILDKERIKIQTQASQQNKIVVTLRQEIEVFTKLMNTRIEFFRQLQQVSDMVAPLEDDVQADEEILANMVADEANLESKISSSNTRRRYLFHLKDNDDNAQDERMCVICQESFEVGSLTICGHQFCSDCIREWWRHHHSCPVCKRRLREIDLHDVTYRPNVLKVAQETVENVKHSAFEPVKKSAIYSEVSDSTLNQIKNIDLDGPSFTTKVDTIARHLIWLRE
jgi:E3 ubiquitin-protein ligase SHPRH